MSSQGNNSSAKWLGLLRWSMTYSDGTTPSSFQEMSKDDREWLEQVMKENVRNEPERMNEIMLKIKKILSKFSPSVTFDLPSSCDADGSSFSTLSSLLDSIEYDLDDLRDIVEQVDMALVFAKCGGCDVLLSFIENTDSIAGITIEMRALAASILATITQNHVKAQDLLIKAGMIDKLSNMFLSSCSASASSSSLLHTKLLFALSCLIRGHPTGEELFMMKFADLVFSQALRFSPSMSSSSRTEFTNPVVSRALFLANALIVSDYCTSSRAAKLSLLFVPFCLDFLISFAGSSNSSSSSFASTSRDARDNVFLLLSTLLHTSPGYVMIHNHSSYAQQLCDFMALEEKQLSKKDSVEVEEDEEKEHLQQQVNELKRVFSSPLEVFYPSKQAEESCKIAANELRAHHSVIRVGSTVSARERAGNIDQDNVHTNETETSGERTENDEPSSCPVLLIEPPPLRASSVAP
jgi:hypothetical protein